MNGSVPLVTIVEEEEEKEGKDRRRSGVSCSRHRGENVRAGTKTHTHRHTPFLCFLSSVSPRNQNTSLLGMLPSRLLTGVVHRYGIVRRERFLEAWDSNRGMDERCTRGVKESARILEF